MLEEYCQLSARMCWFLRGIDLSSVLAVDGLQLLHAACLAYLVRKFGLPMTSRSLCRGSTTPIQPWVWWLGVFDSRGSWVIGRQKVFIHFWMFHDFPSQKSYLSMVFPSENPSLDRPRLFTQVEFASKAGDREAESTGIDGVNHH